MTFSSPSNTGTNLTFTLCFFTGGVYLPSKSYTLSTTWSFYNNPDKTVWCLIGSIQFNSKTLFQDVDPVSSQLIFPGTIQTGEQHNNLFIHIYKTTEYHRTSTGKHNLHFHTKHIHKHLYNVKWNHTKCSEKYKQRAMQTQWDWVVALNTFMIQFRYLNQNDPVNEDTFTY